MIRGRGYNFVVLSLGFVQGNIGKRWGCPGAGYEKQRYDGVVNFSHNPFQQNHI